MRHFSEWLKQVFDSCNSFVWFQKSTQDQIRSREMNQAITQLLVSSFRCRIQVQKNVKEFFFFIELNPSVFSLHPYASLACSHCLSRWLPFSLIACPLHLSFTKCLPFILLQKCVLHSSSVNWLFKQYYCRCNPCGSHIKSSASLCDFKLNLPVCERASFMALHRTLWAWVMAMHYCD